jgi:uncharacterized protein (TIGR03000 family)
MKRQGYWATGLVVLAVVTLLLVPAPSQAQRWGVGVGRGGVYFGNTPYYYGTNYNYGWGYSPWVSNYNYPWGINNNYGYSYYPSYSYGRTWYAPGYYGPGDNYYSGDMTSPYYNRPTGEGNFSPGYNNSYSYGAMPANRAHVTLRVPADAEVWFEGVKTQQGGTVRNFVSPPLDPNRQYRYDIRARWNENGREVSQTRQLTVNANSDRFIDFTRSGSTEPATTEDMEEGRGNRTPRSSDLDRNNLDRGTLKDRNAPADRDLTPNRVTPPVDRTTPPDREAKPETPTRNRAGSQDRTTDQPRTNNPGEQPQSNPKNPDTPKPPSD